VRRIGLLVVAAAVVILASSCTNDLGTLGGDFSRATGLNDDGVVVGTSMNVYGQTHGFRLAPGGSMRDLPGIDSGNAEVSSVNPAGQVLGSSNGRAVRWEPDGTLVDLDQYLPPNPGLRPADTLPADVNDAGIVVGTVNIMFGEGRLPIVRDATGTWRQLPSPYFGEATGINGRGEIVGWSFLEGGPTAVEWVPDGAGGWADPVPLPAVTAGDDSGATDINDDGTIAGYDIPAGAPDQQRAVVWRGPAHELTVIPSPPGRARANAVNEVGLVVRELNASGDIWSPRRGAFRWAPGDEAPEILADLEDQGAGATAVNRAGAVVGTATVVVAGGRQDRAVAWDPR
jgi:probable HAF family extracellular repeat protein